ncbi:hypothetical protein K0U00_42205, partial [Paenibacillus sepulcri]|nr:hypothetical protein [Paenibacillus sepulcri]
MRKLTDGHSLYIVDKTESTGPAAFGTSELYRVLSERGIRIERIPHWSSAGSSGCLVIGTMENRQIRVLLERQQADIPHKPEGLIYQWCAYGGQPVLVAAGTDGRGLMYGLLELAERIQSGGAEALNRTENELANPDHAVRGLDRYIMGPHDDEWFYSAEFWHYYFSRLAYSRYNRFVLITGWDTSHFSPPYPFFVEIPGFTDMTVAGFSADDR